MKTVFVFCGGLVVAALAHHMFTGFLCKLSVASEYGPAPIIKVDIPKSMNGDYLKCIEYESSIVTNTSVSYDWKEKGYPHPYAGSKGKRRYYVSIEERAIFVTFARDPVRWESTRSTPITNWSKKVTLGWSK